MSEKDQVIQALRATLISVKGALTLKQCNRDYRELQGEWIPFKKLGYQTLEKLFLDVPGFKVTQINGDWYVDAIASQETQHIASMVSKQKSSKKPAPRLSYASRFPKKQGSWRKPAPPSSYQSDYSNEYSNQYYRARRDTSYNNNYYSNKFNGSNKFSKPNEQKTTSNYAKPMPRQNIEIEKPVQKTVTNNITTTKEVPKVKPVIEEIKHSVKPEKDIAVKPNKVSASQRLTNLRDRLNAADLIPLQMPAAKTELVENSGPVSNVTSAPALEPPPESTSSVKKLEWTCRKLGLPQPVYKIYDHRPKREPVSYDCTIKVGPTYAASSYPDSSASEELAKEVGAVKLLAVIESLEAGGLPTSSMRTAVAQLTELVGEHEAGVWASTLPHLYREKYKENLPSNWLELAESCPNIITERLVNGLVLLPPTNEESLTPVLEAPIIDDVKDSDLPPLQFPDDDFWNVFITVANSTLEIWLRIIGLEYSDATEKLLKDMADYYEHSGTLVDKVMLITNAWYAVNLEDGGWQRAKILEIEDETATVFIGDHGDDDTVYLNKIKILEPQFRKLPAQAILCRLEGAEELGASEECSSLVRRRLTAEVVVAAPGARADPADPAVPVVLYDTSTQRDLNLNKEIVHDLCIAAAFTVTQKPCEVEVGCVTEEGRVWVSRAGGSVTVQDALQLLTAGPYRRPLPPAPPAPAPAHSTLYIVKTRNGDWVRCTIISGVDGEGTVRTQLVDSGLVMRAPLSSLVPLAALSPALAAFPHQALQVRLGGAERAAGSQAARLRELLIGSRVLCRALPAPPSSSAHPAASPPLVELFVRSGPQNILASVNNAIVMEYEYSQTKVEPKVEPSKENHLEALSKKKERIFRSTSSASSEGGTGAVAGRTDPPATGSGALPAPALPAQSKCFDVYVAMAANPWNFVVQPNSTRHQLQSMMASLQEECPKLSETEAPTSPATGELYTVYYDKDASWYRVTVAGSVSSKMVSVYFCDYGDLALFATQQLRPVPSAAPLARSLPPQAIKAKLYDVFPLHQDWAVEDCIRFQELCVEQQFVGICKDVGRDPLNPNEPLLTLDLIDTSTDEDIYLNKLLVSEGRARLGTTST